jgi:hypothetical protein
VRTTWDDELSVRCPLYECSRPAGVMCVYVTAPAGCGHEMGQECQVPHRERRKVGSLIRSRREEQARLERLAAVALPLVPPATVPPAALTPGARLRTPLLGYNREERAAMRAWLAEYGPVLWQDPGYLWSGLRITLSCGHTSLVERPREPEYAALYVIGAPAACWVCPARTRVAGGQVAAVRQITDVTGVTAPREPESLEPIHWYWEGMGH